MQDLELQHANAHFGLWTPVPWPGTEPCPRVLGAGSLKLLGHWKSCEEVIFSECLYSDMKVATPYIVYWFSTCSRWPCVQSCLTLCISVDCSPSDSSVPGILQARILEWVAISFSRGSSPPRDLSCVSYVSCIGRWVFFFFFKTASATWEVLNINNHLKRIIYLYPISFLDQKIGKHIFNFSLGKIQYKTNHMSLFLMSRNRELWGLSVNYKIIYVVNQGSWNYDT